MTAGRLHLVARRAAAVALLALAGCRTGRDYLDENSPRYAGTPAAPRDTGGVAPATIRIVSFNIEFARDIDGALALLRADSMLHDADVLLLQEMDAPGTQRMAESLGMWYVYYPAIFHVRMERNFGNAILSRWPIVDDAKLVLPHPSRYAGTHRIATGVTLRIGAISIRAYSVHLGTIADIGGDARGDQLRAVIDAAAKYPAVVIGGDLNDGDVGAIAATSGYIWPTRDGPRTTRFGRWDHLFVRGFPSMSAIAAGTGDDTHGVSDHRPVWVSVRLRVDRTAP